MHRFAHPTAVCAASFRVFVEVGEAPSCTARTWHLPSGIGPIRSRVSVYTSGLYWARFLFVFLGLSN